ncbi:uncharacterized protein LOC116166170 [Photinus pyralis]|uniref:uncharacterized protein LOC116166170 n=1 Tax=Photinus pyralis TaxID=7054 RepID=UPI001266EDDD|nr:uncharacterized protein LOC116166170 [Photinus pyralis]
MSSGTFKYLTNIHCHVCRRRVKLVPVRYMSWLQSPNFSFKKLIKVMLRYHQYFLCSLCSHWVYHTAILNTDYSGMSYCFVCKMKIIKPFAFLSNYNNPLFQPKEHIIDRRYVHKECVAISEILRLVYMIIESDDWTLLKHIRGYKVLTPYLCAPIVIPTKIPRPFGKICINHTLPKLQVDLEEVENQMRWLCIQNPKAILF